MENSQEQRDPAVIWHNLEDWGVEGKGWSDTSLYYDRLPARAESRVREPVWELSRHSAGMCVRFVTDATSLQVRYALTQERLAMPHMPASGVSGLDLYAEDHQGNTRWVSIVAPENQEVETTLAQNLAPGSRRYTLYLPLYNGVASLEIGVASGATFEIEPPRNTRPIVFYGTSITHGACASRPGMAFPAILGRRLALPTINLGFSGNGQMDLELADYLGELDPCAFVIDCLPNMTPELVAERAEAFVSRLRSLRPDTPILMVEDRTSTGAVFQAAQLDTHRKRRSALSTAFAKLVKEGTEGLHYMDGAGILGDDGEAATDGSHPNDLGMVRYADAYEPVLREIL